MLSSRCEENADQGILLAATTEHFLSHPASQVRLS